MARAAVLGRLTWRVATVAGLQDETPTARTVVFDVPGWPGHLAGQHVDVRLTAPDGYSAVRSYSIAAPPDGDRVELTVERLDDGEVSPYLTEEVAEGDQVEVRGPVGGWFVWRRGQPGPVQLVGGGSGVVPLMCMVRAMDRDGGEPPPRLLYSARTPEAVLYRAELERGAGTGLGLTFAWTRRAPDGWPRPPGRIDADLVAATTWPPGAQPTCYVCGPTAFVEVAAALLVSAGHPPDRVRTERFGASGGRR